MEADQQQAFTLRNVYLTSTNDSGETNIDPAKVETIKVHRGAAINARDAITFCFQKDAPVVVCSGPASEILSSFSKVAPSEDLLLIHTELKVIPDKGVFPFTSSMTLGKFLELK